MKQSHVRQSLVFLEQLAHMRHGHVRLVFLKLVILERILANWCILHKDEINQERVWHSRGYP